MTYLAGFIVLVFSFHILGYTYTKSLDQSFYTSNSILSDSEIINLSVRKKRPKRRIVGYHDAFSSFRPIPSVIVFKLPNIPVISEGIINVLVFPEDAI